MPSIMARTTSNWLREYWLGVSSTHIGPTITKAARPAYGHDDKYAILQRKFEELERVHAESKKTVRWQTVID